MRDGENQTLNMSLSRKCFSADHLPSRPAALLGTSHWASLRNVSLRKYEQKNIRRGNSRYYFKSSNRVLFFFIIFNGCSSEWFAIIVQVISWIIELDFQGGRRTIDFVMFIFNVFD